MNSLGSIDSSNHTALLIASNITSGLSFLGGCWIFFTFCRIGRNITYSGKMVLCMNICYFIYTITNLLANFNEAGASALCQIEAFFSTFAVLSAFFWAWKISQIAYYAIMNPDFRPSEQTTMLKIIRGFILPLLISAIPLVGFELFFYKYVGPHCGIGGLNDTVALIVYLSVNIIPPLISLISTAYFAYKISRFSKSWGGDIGISSVRLLVYPIGLCAIWLPSFLATLLSYFASDFLVLELIRICLTHLLGFIHAVIYVIQARRVSKSEEQAKQQQSTLNLEDTNSTSLECSFEISRPRISTPDFSL